MYRITSEEIIYSNEKGSGSIYVEGGNIADCPKQPEECEIIDLSRYTVMPGLIDIHTHGGMGTDVTDGSTEDIIKLAGDKTREGVTGFCPSTVTTSLGQIKAALRNISEAMKRGTGGARIIGVFLEGPYLSEKYRGAHAAEFLRKPEIAEIRELIEEFPGVVKSIAIAPELEGAPQAIKYLTEQGVNVRIGHSAATSAQAKQAIDCGANIAIHTYNAMSPLNHREPGMVGTVLADDRIFCELICDFIHVNETACEVVYKCKGADKTILITDCISPGGMPDGEYKMGELKIIVKDSIARTETGALGGSSLKLIHAVRNVNKSLGIGIVDAVKMASLTPARALGIDNLYGCLTVGKKADIIAVDADYNIVFMMIDGKIIFNKA